MEVQNPLFWNSLLYGINLLMRKWLWIQIKESMSSFLTLVLFLGKKFHSKAISVCVMAKTVQSYRSIDDYAHVIWNRLVIMISINSFLSDFWSLRASQTYNPWLDEITETRFATTSENSHLRWNDGRLKKWNEQSHSRSNLIWVWISKNCHLLRNKSLIRFWHLRKWLWHLIIDQFQFPTIDDRHRVMRLNLPPAGWVSRIWNGIHFWSDN
jgi:hypothetical protein